MTTFSLAEILAKLKKYASLKSPNKKHSSEDGETLSYESVYYRLYRELDPKGMGHLWGSY
jgi:hypothetical protein